MLVELIAHTNDPERTIAAAAKLCYSDAHIDTLLEGLTPEKTAAFLQKLSDVGHASPIEHASFTFGIEGVSRTFLAQVTRHRIGSFSVQSQRYVRLEDFRYVIPPEIEAMPEAKAQFIAVDERRRKKIPRARPHAGECPHRQVRGRRAWMKRPHAPRPPSRPTRTPALCCPTPARPRWS